MCERFIMTAWRLWALLLASMWKFPGTRFTSRCPESWRREGGREGGRDEMLSSLLRMRDPAMFHAIHKQIAGNEKVYSSSTTAHTLCIGS